MIVRPIKVIIVDDYDMKITKIKEGNVDKLKRKINSFFEKLK